MPGFVALEVCTAGKWLDVGDLPLLVAGRNGENHVSAV
jgi:hypothetical protein